MAARAQVKSSDDPIEWRVPQEFSGVDSYEVRAELQTLLERDLLGPWDGEAEVFMPQEPNPREKYLIGMIGPKRVVTDSRAPDETLPDPEIGADGSADDAELSAKFTTQDAGKIWASSMGLSCLVIPRCEVLVVTASWGRYSRTGVLGEDGVERQTWAREPISETWELRFEDGSSQKQLLQGDRLDGPCVYLQAEIRCQEPTGAHVVQIALVNALDEPRQNKDESWLFQAKLEVYALDGADAVFGPIAAQHDAEDPEESHLDLLYRDSYRFANGHNVAVHATVDSGAAVASMLATNWIPVHDVPSTVAPSDDPRLAGLELAMDELAELPADRLGQSLRPLAGGYADWLAEQAKRVPELELTDSLRNAAAGALWSAERVAQRIAAGIEVLIQPGPDGGPSTALEAFRFANRAMADQRRHTQIAARRAVSDVSYRQAEMEVKDKGAQAASWRPFQLAFVLLNIPAIADPGHPERRSEAAGLVDLLFFPTGGGKTEAYLGLTAFTFAIRRLQGVVGQYAIDEARASGSDAAYHRARAGARDGSAGVAVLMRYTLRLLTAQQFQRAATLVCAAEMLRREKLAAGDERWGQRPFRIGMWVGQAVSPNWYGPAEEQISQAKAARGKSAEKRANVLQTKSCPWCGQELKAAGLELRTDSARRRVLLYCARGEEGDACPFSRLGDVDDGLPILTVDEEIYRLLPDLVIATVDKLAQLPWKGYAGMLFGRVSRECSRHGFRHDDLDVRTECTDTHHATKDGLPRASTTQVPFRLRPPDLIIQDELHLISGALGTSVGLFESAVDALTAWPIRVGAETVITGPKIVASTATTKRAKAQVRGVFDRDLAVFPPPVLDIADTFFSRQVPVTKKNPGRRYLGICAHGTRLKAAEIRLAEILLTAGQDLFDKHGAAADPYMTLVGYFNATRELAGMRRYLDDDVSTRLRIGGTRRDMANRLQGRELLRIQELTSRISSGDITAVLQQLQVGFDPDLHTSTRREAIRAENTAARKAKPPRKPTTPWLPEDKRPVDVVLATSMLQVGVDVSRFGLMMVTGQPKNTAEYIQASSRVGRDADKPGLVITLANWSRPRDLAYFEDFEHYHSTFYRQVEALSVTPYAARSIDRGSTGAFVAAIRNINEGYSDNVDAQDVNLEGPYVDRMLARFLTRAESVAGPDARSYVTERLGAAVQRWGELQSTELRTGYRDATVDKQPIYGILESPGGSHWHLMTVALSMRETENEINLLLPPAGLFDPEINAPDWDYATGTNGGDEAEDDHGPATEQHSTVEF